MNRSTSQTASIAPLEEDLLELYLTLPKEQREKRFSDTARAAEITGLSIRTIQFWIESGLVQAVNVGRKYRVDLLSLREHLKRQIHERA